MKIYHFNPETDYALACELLTYTPPARVLKLRNQLALLPALYAEEGSTILLNCNTCSDEVKKLHFANLAKAKNLNILFSCQRDKILCYDRFEIVPWGWNKSLRYFLASAGFNEEMLPSYENIDTLKRLSHRATTIEFFRNFPNYCNEIMMPLSISDEEEALDFWKKNHECCFKAPWSSSGRGIIFGRDLSETQVSQWIHGIIRSQGCVMAEPAYNRALDFATEWIITDNRVDFMGFSIFSTSSRGKYKYNLLIPQKELLGIINSTAIWNDNILLDQREFIEEYIAPFYKGPLGFDMLATADGIINPCVEINLRHTMGLVSAQVENQIETASPDIVNILRAQFPENKFII